MSSQQPNFLAALGEAGAAAIPAFRSARDAAEADKLKLQGGLYDIDMKRQARNDALSAAGAKQQTAKGFGIDAGGARGLVPYLNQVNRAFEELKAMGLNPNSDVTDPALGYDTPDKQMKAQAVIDNYTSAAATYDAIANELNFAGINGVASSAYEDPTAPDNVSD